MFGRCETEIPDVLQEISGNDEWTEDKAPAETLQTPHPHSQVVSIRHSLGTPGSPQTKQKTKTNKNKWLIEITVPQDKSFYSFTNVLVIYKKKEFLSIA